MLDLLADLGPDVLSIDWRVDPRDARARVGSRCALQGNLDPSALFASPETVARLTNETLDRFGGEPGHIFNLGSGILPKTPIPCVEAVVETVKARRGTGEPTR